MKRVLSFDMGASSGRGVIGCCENGKLEIHEVTRFSNDPVYITDELCWDTPRHLFEIKRCIGQCAKNERIDCIGIDTWGVDFGLIDKYGCLMSLPVHYRDKRTLKIIDEVLSLIPRDELYRENGIQHMNFNTIYQLYYLHKYRPDIINAADKMLLIPDLIAYFLTRSKYAELTNVSTTGLIDQSNHDWNYNLIEKLGFKRSLFPQIITPGSFYGELCDEVCRELECGKIPVAAACTHDTASAVLSVPSKSESILYISSGTWSLMGTELDSPIINESARKANYTNEIGYGGNVRFLSNIMGLWLIQETRRQYIRDGEELSFAEMEKEALSSKPFACFIDVDSLEFASPGNMPERIRNYCKNTGQHVPEKRGEVIRCIYESLAMRYRENLAKLEKICSHSFERINIVGGGIKDTLLCGMTASACNRPVTAGPAEATVIGNICTCLSALGELGGISEIRDAVINSVELKDYSPTDADLWDENYEVFKKATKGE